MLPDGTKIERLAPITLIPEGDDSSQSDDDISQYDNNFSQDDDDSFRADHDYNSDDEEDVPTPEETLDFFLSNKKTWILPSGNDFNDIVAKRISENAKQWFLIEDREFIMKDYKALLQVSEMSDKECSFIKLVEDMVHKGKIDEAFKFCTEKHLSSGKNSYISKISKIYANFRHFGLQWGESFCLLSKCKDHIRGRKCD
ncbi:hypothetical protein GLOIN_2v1495217 [Rhizophagus clarus]|uniref:Uncharacterized protein n=1 Tax=Rhizophagus clarus TaxID=94130 RepID=A0A8H3KWV3_9GLOM|nr:hypothetical protein GLOIN_2v1495217 [Rhizophagus clarus]